MSKFAFTAGGRGVMVLPGLRCKTPQGIGVVVGLSPDEKDVVVKEFDDVVRWYAMENVDFEYIEFASVLRAKKS